MINQQWEAVHSVLVNVETLLGSDRRKFFEQQNLPAVTGQDEIPGDMVELRDLVRVREQIRINLNGLRNKLGEHLSERDCYLALFPLVAHFDEVVQTTRLDANQVSWPPLQRELFGIDDAGEMFYETLNDILVKPQTFPFIYEVFYYCLNDGFRGKYADNPMKITEYMEILRSKINTALPAEKVEVAVDSGRPGPNIRGAWRSPLWYYAGAAVVVGVLYFILLTFAKTWVGILD